jgi:hypothetical protein
LSGDVRIEDYFCPVITNWDAAFIADSRQDAIFPEFSRLFVFMRLWEFQGAQFFADMGQLSCASAIFAAILIFRGCPGMDIFSTYLHKLKHLGSSRHERYFERGLYIVRDHRKQGISIHGADF